MISYYYPETLRSITVALLERFSHIQVHRFNKEHTTVVKVIDVPLTFAPVEKAQQDRTEDYTVEPESLGQRYYLQIPRLALNLNSITYSPERAAGVNEFRYFADNTPEGKLLNSSFKDSIPTPYNLTYTLFIRTDSMADFSQIIENIIPYFNPKLYLRVKEFSFMNLERDLSVILNDISPAFTDELDKTQKRQIDGTITFTVEGWFYKPVSTAKLVKLIKTRFYTDGTLIDGTFNLSSTGPDAPLSALPPAGTYNVSAFDPSTNTYFFISNSGLSDNVTIMASTLSAGMRTIQPVRIYTP